MVQPLRDEDRGVSNWVVLLVLVIIVGAVLGVYFGYLVPGPPTPPITAQIGDTVEVDYVGLFPNSGVVFDTSNVSVARNNASYPKASSFTWRGSWTPITVTLGQHKVVKGFEDGLLGLRRGESTTLVVSPAEGYGLADPAKFHVHSLLESVPVRTTWNSTGFTAYFHTSAISGSVVTDPVWGWPVTVSVANGIITAVASPTPGEAILPYGAWDAQVLSIDDPADNGTGVVLVQHRMDSSLVDRVGGKDPYGNPFYVSAVDLSAGTYTLNFNPLSPPVGRTLVFEVTVVTLLRIA